MVYQTGDMHLALLVIDKEESTGDVVVYEISVCSGHETVKFNIMKRVRKESSRLQTPEFRRADFSLFRRLVGGSTWEAALKGKGSQKIWKVLRTASSKCRNCPSGKQADVPGDCFVSAGNS